MSGSIPSTNSGIGIGAPAGVTSSASNASQSMLGLGSNYQTFLKLLMTQLQNQDPTNPLDTNQFTSQLVQYSQVEQQITTNQNLQQLIQLNQSNAVIQSAAVVGRHVAVDATQLSLQSGQAALSYNMASAGPVTISVTGADNQTLLSQRVDARGGSNTWTWDGKDQSGIQQADGAYAVTVTDAAGNNVSYTVQAVATGISQAGGTVMLQMGDLDVPYTSLRAVE